METHRTPAPPEPASQTNEEFTRSPGNNLCTNCRYYAQNPVDAPGYWTWSRAGEGRWIASSTWSPDEPPPEPGDIIDVHRKDGSTTDHVITQVDTLIFDLQGRPRIHCWVQ